MYTFLIRRAGRAAPGLWRAVPGGDGQRPAARTAHVDAAPRTGCSRCPWTPYLDAALGLRRVWADFSAKQEARGVRQLAVE